MVGIFLTIKVRRSTPMMNKYDSNIIPIIESYVDKTYIKDIDNKRPDKLLDDTVVRNKIDDYRLSGNDKVRDEVLFAFGNFAVSVAKQYQGNGLPICDLIGEGMIGLIDAINGYDSSNPTKFITYAGVVISRQIREALDQMTLPVRVPKNIRNTMHKVKKRSMDQQLTGGTVEEIYDQFNDKEQVFVDKPFMYQKVKISSDSNNDDDLPDGPNIKHIDLVKVSDDNPDANMIAEDLKYELNFILKDKLTKIERKVIKLFYGINRPYPINSMYEIGQILHITGERARQIMAKAMTKLKESDVKNTLTDYI